MVYCHPLFDAIALMDSEYDVPEITKYFKTYLLLPREQTHTHTYTHTHTHTHIWQHFCVVVLSRSLYIEMSHSVGEMKCRSRTFCRIIESFMMGLNPSHTIMYRKVDLLDKQYPE